jgi:hypothetical protein
LTEQLCFRLPNYPECAEWAGTEKFTRAEREDAAARARFSPLRALMKIRGAQIPIAKAGERRVEY